MRGIVIDHDKCIMCGLCITSCTFNALDDNGKIEVNGNCRVCKICINHCPTGAISLVGAEKVEVDKEAYQGNLVFAEHFDGDIHPVTLELIRKAQELASVTNQEVNCLMIGDNITDSAKSLLE